MYRNYLVLSPVIIGQKIGLALSFARVREEPTHEMEIIPLLEPVLRSITEDFGLPYIPPTLSAEGLRLLERSEVRFLKRYLRELRSACRSGIDFVYV